MPAAIALLEDAAPVDFLTAPNEAADILPSADANKNLFWVRTYRRGGTTGRAFWRDLSQSDSPEIQLSGVPTLQISVSPSGGHFVYTTRSRSGFEVRTATPEDLRTKTARYEAFGRADLQTRSEAVTFEENLRAALVARPIGGKLSNSDLGPVLLAVPTPEDVRAMGDAFRAAARRVFHLNLRPGLDELRQVDSLMNEVGDYMKEEPPLILALAGVFVDALPGDTIWHMEDAAATLSSDVLDPISTDGFSYTAVQPFGVARERIAGRMELAATAERLLAKEDPPYILTENFTDATLQRVETAEWIRAGMPTGDATLGTLVDLLKGTTSTNDIANVMAVSIGRSQDSPLLELQAALNLAHNNPASGEALRLLGRVLSDNMYTQEAHDVLRQAVLLSPTDFQVRLAFADTLLHMNDLDKALEQYEIAGKLDQGGAFIDVVEGRKKLVENLRKEDPAP